MPPLALALLVAFGLRLLGAWLRPVWVDEAATAIFSAGNSSWSTPLNTVVPVSDFISALRIAPADQLTSALGHLHIEDNHPPLHFALGFLSAQLLQNTAQVLDPLTARLPAVLTGSLAVPLLAGAVQTASGGNAKAARLAGLLIAVSPFAVALGLEARHYALAMTLVCGALWALAAGWQRQLAGRDLGIRLLTAWLAVNALGLLTHHLFVLCIAAQLFTLVVLSCAQRGLCSLTWRVLWVPLLSLTLALAWLSQFGGGGAADQTAWLAFERSSPSQWLVMPLQLLISALTGLLAPGTTLSQLWQWPFVIAAGLATAIGLVAVVWLLLRSGAPEPLLVAFTLGSAAMLIGASVLSGKDFSRALRYSFVVLPGLLSLVAVAATQSLVSGRRRALQVLLGCSLLCSLGVASGVALPASYNPELFLQEVNKRSSQPVVVVFNDRLITSGRPLIGYEGLSIAWHLQRRSSQNLSRGGFEPKMLLLGGNEANRAKGLEAIQALQSPLDLWVVNAHGTRSPLIARSDCKHQRYASAGGHLHDHYRCGA